MSGVRVLLLRAPGTNCDRETEHAWTLAGAQVRRVTLAEFLDAPQMLETCEILTIPGGFSYGDDIAAGRVFAARLRRGAQEELLRFVGAGRLILGICNGFQVLVQAGLLPEPRGAGSSGAQRTCSVTHNEPPGFQDRWVTLRANESPCVFTEPGRIYELPIAHGEGRVVFRDEAARAVALGGRQNALSYVPTAASAARDDAGVAGNAGSRAYNPNGSDADIAGLCDPTGRIFGLMPHPERFVDPYQHPCWTSRPSREHGDGLAIFERAVAYFR